MSNIVVQNSSNYVQRDGFLSKIKFHRIPLSNVASNSLALAIGSTTLGEFRIGPHQPFNLGKSFIGYNYTFEALAGARNIAHEVGNDLCSYIYCGDGSNTALTEIQYADRYCKMVRPLRTSKVEFESNDMENGTYPCHCAKSSNLLPFSRDGLSAGTDNSSTKSYDEVRYLRISSASNQELTVNRMLPLSCFKDSFIGLDKNILFNNELFIRFQTQYGNRMGFRTTEENVAHPHKGATDMTEVNAGRLNLRNVYLFLAVETNDKLIQQLKSKMESGGLRMSIPWQYGYRNATQSGSTSSNIQLTFTQQYGNKLKRVITAPFNGNGEKSAYAYDHSNVNGTKVKTFQCSLDSIPLTDFVNNCFNAGSTVDPGEIWTYPASNAAGSIQGDDYREHRSLLVGSAMPSYDEYQTNWFVANVWGMNPMIQNDNQSVPDSDVDDGLSLEGVNKIYSIQFQNDFAADATNNIGGTSGIIAYYTFAHFYKDIIIDKNGVRWA